MNKLVATLIFTFCISLGVTLGGSILGALGAALGNRPPMNTMVNLAAELKVWALVTALGGAFGIIHAFETGIFGGQPIQLIQQLAVVFSAFLGAHLGYLIIIHMAGGR